MPRSCGFVCLDNQREPSPSLGADGFALVKNRTCTHCNTAIICQAESELKRDLFVMCMSCGRILYLAADAAKVEEYNRAED